MSEIYREIAKTIPETQIRKLQLDQATWLKWIQSLEDILRRYRQSKALPAGNLLIPVDDNTYLRIFYTDVHIEAIAFYEQTKSYRFNNTNDHRIMESKVHDVIHINGLYPLYFDFIQKPFLHRDIPM